MNFIIAGTAQHFGRLVIDVDQNNIGFFHQRRYINILKRRQNTSIRNPAKLPLVSEFFACGDYPTPRCAGAIK